MHRCRSILAGSLIAILATATAANADTFGATGSEQTYTVPSGVTWVRVTATGAQGGAANGATCFGGRGSHVATTIAVSPGDLLYVNVGGAGDSHPRGAAAGAAGGFNGGGDGGVAQPGGSSGATQAGGGGGGATDLRTIDRSQTGTLESRIVVAGGGGGGGATTDCTGGEGGATPGPGVSSSSAVGGAAGGADR